MSDGKCPTEGRSQSGLPYAFVSKNEWGSTGAVGNAFVDGRYVNYNERYEPDATLDAHQDARIVFSDVTLVKSDGTEFTACLGYNSSGGTWSRSLGSSYAVKDEAAYPDYLTLEQAKAMGADRYPNRIPDSVLVYDGSQPPGTPLTLTHVTGVALTPSVTLEAGKSLDIKATVTPDDASAKHLKWESSDDSIVTCCGSRLTAGGVGQATITVTTADGGYTASCLVTVSEAKPAEPVIDDPTDEPTVDDGGHTPAPTMRDNPMTAKAAKKVITVKRAKLKKGTITIAMSKAFTVKKAKGTLSFKVAKYDNKAKKRIRVTGNGKVRIAKTLGQGAYTTKVNVTAAGDGVSYKAKTVSVKLKIRVK